MSARPADARDLGVLPHRERLLARLEEEDSPVVLLWGLPGSGRRRLLRVWLEASGESRASLTPADAESSATLRRALRRARERGERAWVCEAWNGEAVVAALEELQVGERLIASVDVLPRSDAQHRSRVAVVGPAEWLLKPAELATWAARSGVDEEASRGLHAITGGWLRVAELALALGTVASRRDLVSREPIRRFLEDRVLGSLTDRERHPAGGPEADAVEGMGRLVELERGGANGPVALLEAIEQLQPRTVTSGSGSQLVRSFDVRLLGAPEVSAAGGAAPLPWPYRRVVSLLAMLLLESDHGLSQERVVDALWPDRPLERARANLNPAVSHLRRWLELGDRTAAKRSCVVLDGGVYRLNPEWRWWLDVDEFEELVVPEPAEKATAEAPGLERLEALERARRLYRGPLLEGFRGAWMRERRRELSARYRGVLRELGDLYAGLGRLADAEDRYRSLLAVEPLDEEVHVAIMRLYARQGREDLVRRQYEKLAALLARELGIHPMDETIREVQRLLGRE